MAHSSHSSFRSLQSLPLSIAVFLATDDYDYDDDPQTISVTSLLKPVRQLILAGRVPEGEGAIDLSALLSRRMGNAIHSGIQHAWEKKAAIAMQLMGYPSRVAESIVVNPPEGADLEDKIAVYVEPQRFERQVGPWKVTGKPDFIGDGHLEDIKTTSVWKAILHSSDDDYVWQGSLYRWLRPDLITADDFKIQWLFTDWQRQAARQDPKYPQSRHLQKTFQLKSLAESQAFVERKLALIERYRDADEEAIPPCEDADLWRSDPVFKYYKNPAKAGLKGSRSTKNFDTRHEATARLVEDGSKGAVIEVPGQVRACRYCPAFLVCTQKDQLIASGELVLEDFSGSQPTPADVPDDVVIDPAVSVPVAA